MRVHELKADPDWFDSIAAGRKTLDIRFDDRAYS